MFSQRDPVYGKDIGHIYKSLSKLSRISSSCEQSVANLAQLVLNRDCLGSHYKLVDFNYDEFTVLGRLIGILDCGYSTVSNICNFSAILILRETNVG